MTYKELQISFEIEATSNYVNLENKPVSKEIEYWLNIGLDKFVKTRYSGINFKRESFDQSQKRKDDLRTLESVVKLYPEEIDLSTYFIDELPSDYMFLIGDRVGLLPNSEEAYDCWELDNTGLYKELYTSPIQCTIDNVDQKRSNKLSDHRYNRGKAKPLRLSNENGIFYYTDGNYSVNSVELKYLKNPDYINIHITPKDKYTGMPEHTHKEIIKLSVQAYLENKTNPRYQSFMNEVNTME